MCLRGRKFWGFVPSLCTTGKVLLIATTRYPHQGNMMPRRMKRGEISLSRQRHVQKLLGFLPRCALLMPIWFPFYYFRFFGIPVKLQSIIFEKKRRRTDFKKPFFAAVTFWVELRPLVVHQTGYWRNDSLQTTHFQCCLDHVICTLSISIPAERGKKINLSSLFCCVLGGNVSISYLERGEKKLGKNSNSRGKNKIFKE